MLVDASQNDQPDKVYNLLSSAVQKRVSRKAFRAQWKKQKAERTALEKMFRQSIELRSMNETAAVHYKDGKTIGLQNQDEKWRLNGALVSDFYAATPESAIGSFARALKKRDIDGALRTMRPERQSSLSSELQALLESLHTHQTDAVSLRGKDRAELSWSEQGVDYKLVVVRENDSWFVEDLHIKRAPK